MDSLRLIIVGQGDINSCLNRCDNVYGKITFTGFLSHEKIKDFYKIADIGVVPSMYEQCPFTVLEMMAYEIPLVMANIEGLKEILNKNECLYVNPIIQADGNIDFNVTELADAILELLNNKVKSETLRKKCRKIVELKFSSISMAGEMLEVFNSLQGRRQNSS